MRVRLAVGDEATCSDDVSDELCIRTEQETAYRFVRSRHIALGEATRCCYGMIGHSGREGALEGGNVQTRDCWRRWVWTSGRAAVAHPGVLALGRAGMCRECLVLRGSQ